MVGMGNDDKDDQQAKATTMRMVGAGNDNKKDGWEVADNEDG